MLTSIWTYLRRQWKPQDKDEIIPPLTWWEGQFHCNVTNEDIECAKQELQWGSLGKDGKGPMAIKLLTELDTDHLENIIIFIKYQPPLYNKVILSILKDRRAEQVTDDIINLIKNMAKEVGDPSSELYNELIARMEKNRGRDEQEG